MKFFYNFVKYFFYLPLQLFFPARVIGRQNLPKKQNYVSVSNHLKGADAIVLGLHLPRARYFLAKKELSKNPIAKFFLSAFGAIFIDRAKLDIRGIKQAIACLKKAPLTIFPEGTRNKQNEQLQEIKGGAAMIAVKAGVPIVPVMIHTRTRFFKTNYLYVAPPIYLPYTADDRFNNQAMQDCTKIIEDAMQNAKNHLDSFVQCKKDLKSLKKRERQAKKLLKKQQRAQKKQNRQRGR